MTQFGPEIDSILAKPGKYWTNEDCKTISALNKSAGRKAVKDALVEVRGGEKPV